MRAYSQREQEAIAQAALSQYVLPPSTGATVSASIQDSHGAYELLQTLIDLECESKFHSLLESIETKLPRL